MKTKIINISIPDSLLDEADKMAEAEYRNRSDLFREALRNYILYKKELKQIYEYGAKQASKQNISKEKINKLISQYRRGK